MACLPIFFSGHRIDRWEGGIFLAYYVAYTACLVIHAADHRVLPAFRTSVLYFAMPLTLVTLLVVGARGRAVRKG